MEPYTIRPQLPAKEIGVLSGIRIESLTKKAVWLSVHPAKVGGDARADRGGDGFRMAASAMAMPSALARQA